MMIGCCFVSQSDIFFYFCMWERKPDFLFCTFYYNFTQTIMGAKINCACFWKTTPLDWSSTNIDDLALSNKNKDREGLRQLVEWKAQMTCCDFTNFLNRKNKFCSKNWNWVWWPSILFQMTIFMLFDIFLIF